MDSLLQSFLSLLVSPPGNLIYHLVLVFAVTGTAQGLLVGRNPLRIAQVSRMLIGLGMLLMAQVILFLASGLSWQGLLEPSSYLPILDRSMIAFSFLWVAWLWAFPKPHRLADALTLLTSVLIIILLTFSLVAWSSQTETTSFNLSWIDWMWGTVSIMITLAGTFLLIMRQPPGWYIGVGMLTLNLVGHLAHFSLGTSQGDYSTAIRLTQLCAYPLLPTLTQRLHAALPLGTPETTSGVSSGESAALPPVSSKRLAFLETWLGTLTSEDSNSCQVLTHLVAQALPADICLYVSIPEKDNDPIVIECGINTIKNEHIAQTTLDRAGFPVLDRVLSVGKMTLIEDESDESLDIRILGNLIGLKKTSDLLLIPLNRNDQPWAALLLFSPYSKHEWPHEDQERLNSLSNSLVQILQHPAKTPLALDGFAVTQPDSSASELVNWDKDEFIERLQKENVEMNTKFVQLQQDILLLGEQLDLPFSNLVVQPGKTDSAESSNTSKVVHLWLEQVQEENRELSEELRQIQDQNSDLRRRLNLEMPEDNTTPDDAENEDEDDLDDLDPAGNLLSRTSDDSRPIESRDPSLDLKRQEIEAEIDALLSEEGDYSTELESEVLDRIMIRIKQDSQALESLVKTPHTSDEELAAELESLFSNEENTEAPTPSVDQLVSESYSEQPETPANQVQMQGEVSENELRELERLISIERADQIKQPDQLDLELPELMDEDAGVEDTLEDTQPVRLKAAKPAEEGESKKTESEPYNEEEPPDEDLQSGQITKDNTES